MCYNRFSSVTSLIAAMRHELVHAWDDCAGIVWDCKTTACSDSGLLRKERCDEGTDEFIRFHNDREECIKHWAKESLKRSGECRDELDPNIDHDSALDAALDAAIDAVFENCYLCETCSGISGSARLAVTHSETKALAAANSSGLAIPILIRHMKPYQVGRRFRFGFRTILIVTAMMGVLCTSGRVEGAGKRSDRRRLWRGLQIWEGGLSMTVFGPNGYAN